MWNGLITALKKARNSMLRAAGDEEREQIERAEFLQAVLKLVLHHTSIDGSA